MKSNQVVARTHAGYCVRLAWLAVALLVGILWSGPAWAQLSLTATINGTVVDATGAVVPQADVTILNQDTHVSTPTQTNDSGDFTVPGLEVGTYTVSVEKSGFETYTETNIILHPSTVATVNATLKAGAVTTKVSVEATATQVETSTSEVSNDIEATQVSTLPLNGRNYQALAAAMPGVTNSSAGTALGTGGRSTSVALDINGLGNNRSFFALDGVWNENTGNMSQNTIVPNPDSLEEVRVLQNNYSAQYSLMGSSVVLLQTKSGTSDFHGDAYEYVRNNAFNARNYFAPAVSTPTVPAIPPYHQNIFGFDVGGPIFIPHHYNSDRQKTFFFISEQWVRLDAPPSSYGAGITPLPETYASPYEVPSTKTIYEPGTSAATCPYPQTAAGSGVYVLDPAADPTATFTTPQAGCPAFPAVNTNSLAYLKTLYPAPNSTVTGANNYVNSLPQITDQRDDELKIDHNFTPKIHGMMEYLHEGQTYKQNSFNSSASGGEDSPVNWETDQTLNQMAQVSLTATLTPSMVNTASVAFNIFDLNLNLSGIDYVNQIPGFSETEPYNGYLSNRIPFVQITGTGAIMQEGIASSRPLHHAGDLDDTISDNWSWLHGKNYIQAGFNLVNNTKRQNVNAGATNPNWTFTGIYTGNSLSDFLVGDAATFLQYSNQVRAYVHGRIFSPYLEDRIQLMHHITATVGLRVWHMPLPNSSAGFASLFEPTAFNPASAPTISTSGAITSAAGTYSLTNGLVINGENGVPNNWVDTHNWYYGPEVGFAWDVFGDGKTSLRGGYGITFTRIFTNQDCSFNCASNPPFATAETLTGSVAAPLTFPSPSGGTLKAPGVVTLANASEAIEASEVQSYSLSLEHQFGSAWFVSVAGAGSLARHLPLTININAPPPYSSGGVNYEFNPAIDTTSGLATYLAPYPGYASSSGVAGITTIVTAGTDNWNALEVAVRHPISHNLYFTIAYTWSHDLANVAINPYNLAEYYGDTEGLNLPNQFTATVLYNIPFFQKPGTLSSKLLGGWKLSDITTLRSGSSFSVNGLAVSNDIFASRPDFVGGQPLYNSSKTLAEWFNTAAYSFTSANDGFYGNNPVGNLLGPGLVDFDMALYKDFHINESNYFEFRAESFNIFNHPNFNNPNSTFGNGAFGQISSAKDPRILELAMRFSF